jgi:hypothetical protein
MRNILSAVLVLVGCVFGAVAVEAADGPVVVIPGKRGVPVIINAYGFDASYTIVEGEWGLDRPGVVVPQIVAGPLVYPPPLSYQPWYPAYGGKPPSGRLEVEPSPNRRLPKPAPSFHQSWGVSSDPLPATLDPQPQPPMMIAPQIYPSFPRRR